MLKLLILAFFITTATADEIYTGVVNARYNSNQQNQNNNNQNRQYNQNYYNYDNSNIYQNGTQTQLNNQPVGQNSPTCTFTNCP